MKKHWPGVLLVENDQNLGFSRACNQGARIAKGELIAFLNNDARVDPEWLNGLLATMARDETIACVGSMIMTWDGAEVEFAGRFDDLFCIAYESLGRTLRPEAPETYSLFVSGGAMLLERNTFLQVGGFDKRYFMYHEDVDLCWRLWTLGRRCAIAPNSVIYHRGGASSKKLQGKVVHGWAQKHLLWTALKNFDDSNLRQCLPMLIYYLVERGRWSEECMAGLIDVFEETQAALSSILSDRKVVQGCREVGDETIFNRCGHPLAFILRIPLFGLMTEKLKAAHSPDLVDFADPRQVFDAMLAWLRCAVSLRRQYAAVWQSDASDKHRRAQLLLQRSDVLDPSGETRFPDSPDLSEFRVEENNPDFLGRLNRLRRAINGYLLRS
jgi:GT2 family glycosyltransferase